MNDHEVFMEVLDLVVQIERATHAIRQRIEACRREEFKADE